MNKKRIVIVSIIAITLILLVSGLVYISYNQKNLNNTIKQGDTSNNFN